MKFTHLENCKCGGQYVFKASGDEPFENGLCPSCGSIAHLMDPLSVSVVAERLLHRSKVELDDGEYTLTILLAATAVETFLTRLFMKAKKMENFATRFEWPTVAEEALWESEFPRSGGFPGPANFVSKRLLQMTFDEFVSSHLPAKNIYLSISQDGQLTMSELSQSILFQKRNRISHWGYVNSSAEDAKQCYTVALAVVGILREMDTVLYRNY